MAMPFSRETYAKEVEEFKEITGADDNLATQMLQVCDGDLQKAVNMHVDGGGFDIAPDQNLAAVPPPSPPLPRDPGSSSNGSDYVRPPRAPRQEVLVDTPFYELYSAAGSSGSRNVGSRGFGGRPNLVDPFRDLNREAQRQEEEMERGDGLANLTAADRKAPTLEDLFRPPLDLMFKGSLEAAREEGRVLNKWILVNVVNPENFQCQTLNRDVWSSEAVKDIVKDSFIFWQVYHKSDDYINYNRFYPIDTYPHVAVIDPRTGERMIVWSKLDACTFAERVTDFLSYQPCPDPSRDEPAPPPKKSKSNGTLSMDEDEQMKAAIAASLEESTSQQQSHQQEPQQQQQQQQRQQQQQQRQQQQQQKDSYTKYLGPDSDPKSELMFRYPDGERKVHSFPSSSKIRALILFAHEHGFSETSHELVTNYPRRNLSELDSTLTLNEVGLYPKETIFIQLRSA